MESIPSNNQESHKQDYSEQIIAAFEKTGTEGLTKEDINVDVINEDLIAALNDERKLGFEDQAAEERFIAEYIRLRVEGGIR